MAAQLVIGRIAVAVAGLVSALALASCGSAPNSVVVSPPSSTTASGTPSGPSQSPTPSTSPAEYTRTAAAAVLKEYLNALVSKDPAAICALDVRTAPANPKKLSMPDCVSLMQGRITGKDWTNLEVDCWAGAKDLAACAGMTPVAAKAEPNELGNFVFDSTQQGLSYAAGTPEGCDPRNSTGCWFVVVKGSDGDLSVAAHWGERVYR